MTNEIIKTMEQSELWLTLNASIKALYEKENREPSEEEYQAVRNMIICKVMLEDEKVRNMMAEYTYNELRKK